MKKTRFGRFYEEFEVGSRISHYPGKTITESDNNLFCLLTMNHHPLHLDREYAAKTRFKKPVVVGTYVASLAVGLSVADISGKAIANLGFDNIRHIAPVFIGDTLRAETEILDKRISKSNPGTGIVRVRTVVLNQDKVEVLSLERHILLPTKE